MSEVHHSTGHPKSFWGLLLELGMISVAVFLGLLADQWREGRHNEELGKQALRNFRTELTTNRASVASRIEYHVRFNQYIKHSLYPDEVPAVPEFKRDGLHPVAFEHTAWDLAVANQALTHIDADLSYNISRLYTKQNSFQTLQNAFMQSAFAPASFASGQKFLAQAIEVYFGDVLIQEPGLVKAYDDLLPQLNRELADVPAETASDHK